MRIVKHLALFRLSGDWFILAFAICCLPHLLESTGADEPVELANIPFDKFMPI